MTAMTAHLEHFADLCMAAQGFRPSQTRLAALSDQDLVWFQPGKPAQFGLTKLGKSQLMEMLKACCSGAVDEPLARAKSMRPNNAEFTAGMAYFDEFECNLRLGVRPEILPNRLAFLAWLIKEQPSAPAAAK
ncbi:hypothetical protein IAE57_00815 [Stenotrophomonas sp. S48]|uniref:hypothetical protein n=1 Tax=unclassified Stenotrophomonas TaxID=196198 RepID=UPI0019020856|nr:MULTISPECIES: hypothetical protein [unclassified Stenotrophomonas]MBK0024693.1 hypothetical protein [Stenotrophomonas sp. S48]MBK0046913.1 hypothetical protein [Stenotrophomonas sp. S49]